MREKYKGMEKEKKGKEKRRGGPVFYWFFQHSIKESPHLEGGWYALQGRVLFLLWLLLSNGHPMAMGSSFNSGAVL